MTYTYQPRNDYIHISILGERNLVEATGPLVCDLRRGDYVVLPDNDDEDNSCWHELDEDGTLILVREYFVLATEHKKNGTKSAYEDFHS